MKLALTLVILLPLLGGIVNAVVGRYLPRRAGELLACAAMAGSLASSLALCALYQGPVTVELASWLKDFDFAAPIALRLDPLSLSLVPMITFVCGIIHIHSIGYMAAYPGHVRYFSILNLFVAAMLVLVLAENLPLLYLGWEGVGFCSYALIGFWYRERRNADAGRKAFIVTRIGDVALGLAIVWLFQLCGTVSITQLNEMAFLLPVGVVTAIGLLFLLGGAGKSAQLPLSIWLPDAMAGPTPVSALIHAATMVTAGVYLLARLLPFISAAAPAMDAIAVTGGVTAFYGASCALAQRDLKRVLAYSTISQVGFMMQAVGVGGTTAAIFHLLVHAFFKALLFLCAGCVITALHHRQDLFSLGGIRRRLPQVYWPLLAGVLCLAGLPPTGGFFSKDAILAALWLRGGALGDSLLLLAVCTVALTSFYAFRLLLLVGEEGPGDAGHPLAPLPPTMVLTLVPLALLALAGGLLDLPAVTGAGLGGFIPQAGSGHLPLSKELLLQGGTTVASLAGLAAAWRRYGRGRGREPVPSPLSRFLLQGWYLDELCLRLVARPYDRLAGVLWQRLDEGIIDDSLDRLSRLLGRMGQSIGRWGGGRVSLSLFSLAAGGALLLACLAWTAR